MSPEQPFTGGMGRHMRVAPGYEALEDRRYDAHLVATIH